MARRIRIEIGGASATARLLDEKAPVACEKIWRLLPIEGMALHARWSGGAAYLISDRLKDPDYRDAEFEQRGLRLPENFNSFLQIGSVNYRADTGELLFCYEQAQVRGPEGNEWAARIADFDPGSDALHAALAATRRTGAARIVVSAADGS